MAPTRICTKPFFLQLRQPFHFLVVPSLRHLIFLPRVGSLVFSFSQLALIFASLATFPHFFARASHLIQLLKTLAADLLPLVLAIPMTVSLNLAVYNRWCLIFFVQFILFAKTNYKLLLQQADWNEGHLVNVFQNFLFTSTGSRVYQCFSFSERAT